MKKVLILLTMCLSLAACGNDQGSNTNTEASVDAAAKEAKKAAAQAAEAANQMADTGQVALDQAAEQGADLLEQAELAPDADHATMAMAADAVEAVEAVEAGKEKAGDLMAAGAGAENALTDQKSAMLEEGKEMAGEALEDLQTDAEDEAAKKLKKGGDN